jgi:hypothetical protein
MSSTFAAMFEGRNIVLHCNTPHRLLFPDDFTPWSQRILIRLVGLPGALALCKEEILVLLLSSSSKEMLLRTGRWHRWGLEPLLSHQPVRCRATPIRPCSDRPCILFQIKITVKKEKEFLSWSKIHPNTLQYSPTQTSPKWSPMKTG